MTGAQSYNYIVETHEQGQRLDAFVPVRCEGLSRNAGTRLIKQGLVTVDNQAKKPSFTLKPGQSVQVVIPQPEPSEVLAQEIPLEILYEDQDLVVINKPQGMVVHPAPGHSQGTVVNALLHHCRDLSGIGGVQRPGIVHRLDKDTSGVLLAAKNDQAHLALCAQFSERSLKKKYLALVHGVVKEDTGTIDLPIARHPSDRKRMHVSTPGKGRDALSLWTVRERYQDASYLEVEIKTGRTHQIRVHLSAMHHPVVGDIVYGGRKKRGKLPQSVRGAVPSPERQMLHAYSIRFIHPSTGKELECKAPLPEDMVRLKEALSKTVS